MIQLKGATVCSSSCWEVRSTSDMEQGRIHSKPEKTQHNFYSGAATNSHFLQGKKRPNVLCLMPNLQEGTKDFRFAAAISQDVFFLMQHVLKSGYL